MSLYGKHFMQITRELSEAAAFIVCLRYNQKYPELQIAAHANFKFFSLRKYPQPNLSSCSSKFPQSGICEKGGNSLKFFYYNCTEKKRVFNELRFFWATD